MKDIPVITPEVITELQSTCSASVLAFANWLFYYSQRLNKTSSEVFYSQPEPMQAGVYIQYLIESGDAPEIDFGNYNLLQDFTWNMSH